MILLLLLLSTAMAAPTPPANADKTVKRQRCIDQLARIRDQVMGLEQSLIQTGRAQDQAKSNLKKLQTLIQLRHQERTIGRQRMKELEDTVRELEMRRETLNEKIALQQKSVRKFLTAIETSTWTSGETDPVPETFEAPRRRFLANLTARGLKELEILRVDLSDADQLQARIQEEKQQIAYLFQDLNEKESVLELNRQLQADLLKRSHANRIAQLENYRKLKVSESQVERLIEDFNARKELEKAEETEKLASRFMNHGEFARLKGKLSFPVTGARVLSAFGRTFDPKSHLYIFKKGVDLQAEPHQPVRAIFPGKVAYSGELPEYGRIAIIDHGNHFYSLCAHLGGLDKKAGDAIGAGDSIGVADETGVVYFEIRSHNVAVNPLQWVSGSLSLK